MLARPDNPPGTIIPRGPGQPSLRVVERLEDEPGIEDDPELFQILAATVASGSPWPI
jgi:hypothetical protein